MRKFLEQQVNAGWYGNSPWPLLFIPLSVAFKRVANRRRKRFLNGKAPSYQASVPVVVVGNISVGGTGKTPCVIELVNELKQRGWKPGIVSRGYLAKPTEFPHDVAVDDSAVVAGDEPLLIAQRTQCPVIIDPERVRAAVYLTRHHDCDVIISDDGLQHYSLARSIEIVLIDGKRGLGNMRCLPAGPLRESPLRLKTVDFVLSNGPLTWSKRKIDCQQMTVRAESWKHLASDSIKPLLEGPATGKVHAVAGLANPERFFASLKELGFEVIEHRFADHEAIFDTEINFADDLPIIMTEKDAVKFRGRFPDNCWSLRVSAEFPQGWFDQFERLLKEKREGLQT